jgi:hypothetical protein
MSTTASPFAKKADSKGGEDFEICPSGLHPAVLVALIDLGTHEFAYQGKKSENRKIFLVWELPSEKMQNGDSFLVTADYTWSLNAKANFRKMLEGWSGRSFKDDEEFDPLILLGRPCVVNVTEGLSANNKKFNEIMGVAAPMKGQVIPKPTLVNFAWHMSQITCQADDIPIPEWVPRNYGRMVADDIRSSKEWQALPKISAEHALDNPIGANGAPIQGHEGPAF